MILGDLDSLFDNLICPYRTHLSKCAKVTDTTAQDVKADIHSKLFKFCMYQKTRGLPLTESLLSSRLNYIWSKLPVEQVALLDLADKLALSKRMGTMATEFASINTVIYLDLPLKIDLGEVTLLTDIYTYTQGGEYKTVALFNRSHMNMSDKSNSLRIVASIIKRATKELLDDNIKHKIYLFRQDTAKLYHPEPIPPRQVNGITAFLSAGLANQAFLPRGDVITCSKCPFREGCTFNISNVTK